MKRLLVVITGGPCAGKTELWHSLGREFPQAELVPEAATELILAGESPERLGPEDFQRQLFRVQRAREEEALLRGSFLICDRGLPDGGAYCPSLFADLKISIEEILRRYDLVLHPAVIPDRELYLRCAGTNPARREPHAQALTLDRRIGEIYGRHPGYVPLAGTLEQKKAGALAAVRGRLAGPA